MLVQIQDDAVEYRFEAEVIAGPVDTRLDDRKRQRARWMEAVIYRKDDGSYVFTQSSYSTVWHCRDGAGHVRSPVETTSDQLPERPVYCGVLPARGDRGHCPPMDLAVSRRVIPRHVVLEAPQHRVWACPDPQAVTRRMTLSRHRGDGAASAMLSAPMRELLAQAMENDPAFREVQLVVNM